MLKKKIIQKSTSTLLALVLLITAIPFASWTVVASTILPDASVGAHETEDDSVGAELTDNAVSSSDITVNYPTSTLPYTLVEDRVHNSYNLSDVEKAECDSYIALGVFDPKTYIEIYTEFINNQDYCKLEGNQLTYYVYALYGHWITFGIREGRCASPFFCIGCYLTENPDLYNAFINTENPYWSAWEHFKGFLDSREDRVLSPIFKTGDYSYYNPDVNALNYTARQLLDHLVRHGTVTANDIRRSSSRVDTVAYFFDNSSLYHSENGIAECYRKLITEMTIDKHVLGSAVNHKESYCYYHGIASADPSNNDGDTYNGHAQLEDSFTGTLTNIGIAKNLAVNNDGTVPTAVTPGNTANELWQFIKQGDGTYTIEIAPNQGNLTYDGDSTDKKYLGVEVVAGPQINATISSTPTNWHIYDLDGFYMLRPELGPGAISYVMSINVLNISDSLVVNATMFNNSANESTAYNDNTLNQIFTINTTYKTEADSDGLDAEFYATIDAFKESGWDTKVALTPGDRYLRTRALEANATPCADQIWHFIRQNDGTYRIINTANGLYLDSSETPIMIIPEWGIYATDVKEYDANSLHQKWVVRKRDNGGYFIMPFAIINFCYDGTFFTLSDNGDYFEKLLYCVGFTALNQSVFDIVPTATNQPYAFDLNGADNDEPFYAYISSGKSEYSNWYIKNSETVYGNEKRFEDASSENIKNHDYYWKFVRNVDGSYMIYSTTTKDSILGYTNGKFCLDEWVHDTNVTETHSWYIFKYNGGYRLQFKKTGEVLCMNSDGSLTLQKANSNNFDDFQLFKIKETDMTINSVAENFKINLFNYGTRINGGNFNPVLDFVTGSNDGLDKRNLAVGATDGIVPEMSRILQNNFPYVNKYAYVNSDPNDGSSNKYDIPVGISLKPNYYSSGSLEYLFDTKTGFDNGGSSIDHYDPTATLNSENQEGDEYLRQTFNVLNPSGLFQKDSDGYYYYDSSKNAAFFDIDENSKSSNGTLSGTFKLYDYMVHPQGTTPYESNDYMGLFAPFNLGHANGELYYGAQDINYGNKVSCQIDKANYYIPTLTRDVDDSNISQTVTSGDRNKAIDYWYGMTLETDFYQTKDGKLNGQDVKFEFSGDDDLWVYIDGILVLDVGDTHGRLNGSIDFANSSVTGPVKTDYVYPQDQSNFRYADGTLGQMWKRDSSNAAVYETVSLYSVYYQAYEEVKGTDKEAEIANTIARSFVTTSGADLSADNLPVPAGIGVDPEYKDFEQHNLKLYYLERGSGSANASFRLNTFSGGTTVSKEVTGLNEDVMGNMEYNFKAVEVDENGNETPIANSPYTVSSIFSVLSDDDISAMADIVTDENGCFTLKANQKATFGKISPGSKIKIYELTEDPNLTAQWRSQVYDANIGDFVVTNGNGKTTDVLEVPTDSTIDVIFTNDYEPSQNITITKAFDTTNSSETYKPDSSQIYVMGYQLLNRDGKVVLTDSVTLHDGESVVIYDIPVGYEYRVWEYTPEGNLNYDAPQFSVNNATFTSKTFVPQGSNPGTNSYVSGIAKENSNDTIVVKNRLIKHGNITVTFKYFNRKRAEGAPAQIDESYSTFTKELTPAKWEAYLNNSTQRINFSKLIADQGVLFNEKVAVDNLIDDYVVWTSQAEACGENGIAKQTDYFAGKNDIGEYQTYGEVYADNADMLGYHTDAFGNICNCGEKWVTYYKGANIIDPEKQGNDTDVTAINVWLFNRPKQYTLTMHTVLPDDLSTAYESDGLLIGTNPIKFEAFYNQRLGNPADIGKYENDTFNSNEFWETYKITDQDIVSGVDINGNTVYGPEAVETIVDDTDQNNPYQFLYWSYDQEGKTIASTDIKYLYRITRDLELYAVYGKSLTEAPGLTVYKNNVDTYIDASGKTKVRLNTMMNPYNCPDNDTSITNAAIIYVMIHGAGSYKNYTETQLYNELTRTQSDGTTYLDTLRAGIKSILDNNAKSGKVTVIDVTVSASGFVYDVESSSGDTSKPNLTLKNRTQFTTEFTKTSLINRRMLAFAAMKKSDQWIVSDNYIDYDYLN